MKSALLTLFLLAATVAHADPYHRFWRGTKLTELSVQDFQNGLNETFIPQTVQTSGTKGLIAYQPVLTEGSSVILPDEIALVSYRDETAYDSIRSTQEGQDYSALHWKYFDKSKSSSLVPEGYSGTLLIEHAYDLHPDFDAWMTANSHLVIQFRKSGESEADYLQRIKKDLDQAAGEDVGNGIGGRVCLVAENYWVQYVGKKKLNKQVSLNPIVTDFRQFGGGKAMTFPIEHKPVAGAKLKPGSGLNVQF
jgi:hypothetical protein